MAEYQTAIIVDAPLEEVYNQWTQFEEFPRFMDGVLEVRQLDDKRLLWRARIAGVEKQWEAEITDETPNRRIAWKSISGATNAGAVLFEPVPEGTHVTLKLVYDPEGATENVGDALGFVTRRVLGDLRSFRQFIEERQHATGAWRGEIHGQEIHRG
jgi:uncharacterized membrane protein